MDDHEVVRAGLAALVDHERDLVFCGAAASVEEALATAHAAHPDVAVVDWSLGDSEAATLVERLRTDYPRTPVLVLSMHDELHYAARAARAGASGYVMKQEASGKIIAAIRAVASGKKYFSERAALSWEEPRALQSSSRNPSVTARSHDAVWAVSPRLPPWVPGVIVAAILFAIGFVLYESTLPFPFTFDDHPYLLENPLWTDGRNYFFLTEFSDTANRAARLGLDSDISTNFILRPFSYFTFFLNHRAGGFDPAGYRAVNILIHSANAALLFAFVSRLLRLPSPRIPAPDSVRFIPWLAALLFLAHPLQIESVTYVIQRFTSLGTFFFLSAVHLFLLARTDVDEKSALRCRRWSIATLLLGMVSKEFVFLAPFAMLLLDRLLLGATLREAMKHTRPWLFCLPLVPALLIFTTMAQSPEGLGLGPLLNVASPIGTSSPTSLTHADYQFRYALTQPGVILTYLRLLVFPSGLNLDPDYPFVLSPLDWRFLGPFLMISLLCGGAWWRAVRSQADLREKVACMGVLWFFLALSLDSSVVPLPDLMAEHRAYLPSVGFMIAIACLADLARTRYDARSPQRWLVQAGAVITVLALAAATMARNQVWRSRVALWEDTVAKSPNKVRPWMNLGTAYHDSGRWSASVDAYRRALALAPGNAQLWAYLAIAENTAGQYENALAAAAEGMRIDPAISNLYLARAHAFERLGRRQDALATLHDWLRREPRAHRALLGLAGMYFELGDLEEAVRRIEELRSLGALIPEVQAPLELLESKIVLRRRLMQPPAQDRP